MVIGTCMIRLYLPGNGSLKGKRSVLKSIMARVGREFNVSIAEVDQQDLWQSATLGVAAIATDSAYLHGLLSHVVDWIITNRPDVEVLDWQIEIL